MKEKNNILLMIVAVVALIATIGGATYAYFASSITPGEGLNLDITAEASTAQFTVTGGNFGFTVTGAEMQQSQAGQPAGNSSAYLDVRLVNDTEQTITCTYDIKFAWDAGSGYTPTTERGDQFEFGVYGSTLLVPDSPYTYNATQGNFLITGDTNFDKLTGTSASGGLDGYLVKGATISANSTQGGKAYWNIIAWMNNLNHDQSALAGNGTKTYNGRFYVTNVVC